jgi:hypothetical protein
LSDQLRQRAGARIAVRACVVVSGAPQVLVQLVRQT